MTGQDFEVFGTTADGEPVHRVTIEGGGLTANVITWGAVIRDLRLDGHQPPLVLGFENFDDYPAHSPYFGATPGRCSNRIGHGRFTLDGRDYQLECNERGVTHLHGGSDGIGRRVWEIVEHAADKVVLQITDPDGRAGYPGNCKVTATYQLKSGGVLSVTYRSTADQPTLANICQHSYFNLDGRETALDHQIMIAADHVLAVDAGLIPTGELKPVDGTGFDLRQMGPMLRHDEAGNQVLFDHNFCLSSERTEKRTVAKVMSPHSDVSLEVRTTEPGIQFYAGIMVNVPVPGIEGRRYPFFAGFCLETQVWPDAINHQGFPSPILRPGEALVQDTDYVFAKR